MPIGEFKLEGTNLLVQKQDANSEQLHLFGDEESGLVTPDWTGLSPNPHLAAVIQTSDIDIFHDPKRPNSQRVCYDDLLLIDMRMVPGSATGNTVQKSFGKLNIPANKLFLLIGSTIFNPNTEHGYVTLGIGDSVSVGARTGVPALKGLRAAEATHFDLWITDSREVHVQNSFASQGTHVYSGKYAHDRIQWTDLRFQSALGRTSLWSKLGL